MEKIIEWADLISQQAKVKSLADEQKNKQIEALKAEIAALKQRPVVPVESSFKVWVDGEMVAPGVIKWTLNVSEALPSDLIVNIAHTNTETNLLTPYKWTIPKGKTSVSGLYTYKDIKQVAYQVNKGEGYTPGKTAEQPLSLTIVWEI